MTRLGLGIGTIILWKAICKNRCKRRQNSPTVAKVLENKFGQVVEKSSHLISCLFGFVKTTKFRDSSEFSEFVQNVSAKSCLPCQCLYVNKCKRKFFCRARKGLGTSLALQCYAGLVSSSFLCMWGRVRYDNGTQRWTIHSLRSFLYSLRTQQDHVLSVYSSSLRIFIRRSFELLLS